MSTVEPEGLGRDPVSAVNARKMLNACKRMVNGDEGRRSLLGKGWQEDHVLLVEQLSGMSVVEFVNGVTGELRHQLLGWMERMAGIMEELDARHVPKALETNWRILKEMGELADRLDRGRAVEAVDVSPVSSTDVVDVLTGKGVVDE